MLIRRYVHAFLVGVFFFGLFGLVPPVAAEDTCECYCSIEGTGATKVPDESTKVTSSKCHELCRASGDTVATCAYTPDQKPQYNIMCFTFEECTSQGGVPTASGSGTPPQPGECKQGMYYCYPDPSSRIETTLQVSIGDLKVTGDFGEYIASVYRWMLGAGTTIAIVFMMVAGLRWTFGGLSTEQVGKAKRTIQNAMIGLVLLMSTYLILFTVNPYLVNLQVPAFPMIKTVSLVGQGSCGYLIGEWGTSPYLVKYGAPYDSPYVEGGDPGQPYTLENPTDGTNCGFVADVTKDSDGNNVADDSTCTYDYCPEASDRCFPVSGDGYCLSCLDFAYGGESLIEPTSSICEAFNKTTMNGGKILSIETCTYYDGPSLTSVLAALIGIDIAAYTGNPFCYYQESGTCGSSCASYKTQTSCETDLCELSCEWKVTSTSMNRSTGEELEIANCVSK